jgi:hypothetical protein
MKKLGDCVRQGDVLLIRASSKEVTPEHRQVPAQDGRVVVAVGETSLHAHVMRDPSVCMLAREGVSDRVITVGANLVALLLEGGESAPGVPRHGAITVPKGTYVVRTQREWSGEEVRNAAD